MEELIKYLRSVEERLNKTEELEQRLSAAEAALAKSAEQDKRIAELQALVGTLTTKMTLTESRIAQLQEEADKVAAVAAEPVVPNLAEEEAVAIDAETGLPELEVEIIEDIEPAPAPAAAPEAKPEVKPESVAEAVPEPAPQEQPEERKTIADAAQQSSDTVASIVPKVEDLKKAISVGDRFLFQRELFGGNGELMNKTIAVLNELPSLADAEAYITKSFPDWNKESNAYELFCNLLKRRW